MKTRIITSLLIAATLGATSVAFAQENDPPEQRSYNRYGLPRGEAPQQRWDKSWDNNAQRSVQRRESQREDRRWANEQRMGNRGGYYDGRGGYYEGQRYYNARNWHRGDRLPYEWRSRQYVVNDWRGHHLHAPPRGYQWVQVGGDYVLVAIATGIIANLILNQ